MKNKTEIRYWLKDGEGEIDILATETSKVPEEGEIISFGHHWNEERAHKAYSHLSDDAKKTFFPKSERLLDDEYRVVSVKRYISVDYIKTKISDVFPGAIGFSDSTSLVMPDVPVAYTNEQFEVFIEPVRESDSTETPIAKVRNLFGSVVGVFEILKIIKTNPDKEKELMELFKSCSETAIETIPKLRELLRDEKNWK